MKIKWTGCSVLKISLQVTVQAVSHLKDHKKLHGSAVSHQFLTLGWQERRGDSNSVARKSHTDSKPCINPDYSAHTLSCQWLSLLCGHSKKPSSYRCYSPWLELVAMVHRILEACTADFFIPSLLVLNFKLFFSIGLTHHHLQQIV
jgi:hypothetical protein